MLKDSHSDIFTIGVGGAAGDRVKKIGTSIGSFLQDLGFQVYISFDYPSLIRGGHNFVRISFGKERVWNDYSELDILVALNDETKDIHKDELKKDAVVLSKLPLPEILETLERILKEKGFESGEPKGELISGNKAFGKGLLTAGLDFYVAYPMTPSTSILHYLASKQTPEGLKVIQPESETSVINMALGMVYAGKRTAIGSATGGFALMQESFSLAGMAELPLVVAVSQRQAPATGVPTYSSQSDLLFVIHSGHGEFPRIVISPGDSEESFQAGRDALNLAWKFQVPVIILLDKILSEHMITSHVDETASVEKGKMATDLNENYGRYEITEDGVSPMAFPGTPNTVVKATSYEHDEKGITTEKSDLIKKMIDKRFNKTVSIQAEMQNMETVKVYGDTSSENVVVFFGSTKSPVLEASKYFDKPAKLVQILWMEPFDKEKVLKELGEAKSIICVEGNHNAQLASLIREKTGIEITEKILKYDSLSFNTIELANQINTKLL